MPKVKIELKGIDALQREIESQKNLAPVKEVVAKHGALLRKRTQAEMGVAYVRGYSTGATSRSVTDTYTNGGLTAIVAPHTEYFAYLEYGTRFMDAKPTLTPAFNYQKIQFINDLRKLTKK